MIETAAAICQSTGSQRITDQCPDARHLTHGSPVTAVSEFPCLGKIKQVDGRNYRKNCYRLREIDRIALVFHQHRQKLGNDIVFIGFLVTMCNSAADDHIRFKGLGRNISREIVVNPSVKHKLVFDFHCIEKQWNAH